YAGSVTRAPEADRTGIGKWQNTALAPNSKKQLPNPDGGRSGWVASLRSSPIMKTKSRATRVRQTSGGGISSQSTVSLMVKHVTGGKSCYTLRTTSGNV